MLRDRKYGSRQPFAPGIALHARRLVIEHPDPARAVTWRAAPRQLARGDLDS